MAGRERPSDEGVDDWFAEPAPSTSRRAPAGGPARGEHESAAVEGTRSTVDDWLASSGTVRTYRPRFAAALFPTTRGAVAFGVLVLVLLVIGLAAAGVFSGGSRPRALTTSSLPRTTSAPSIGARAVPTQVPTVTLKPGDHGPQVRVLQRALASLGYSAGSIDSQYGAATKRALANFQQANKLAADGILGPVTLAALTHALSNRG
jgi:hypothetical protein